MMQEAPRETAATVYGGIRGRGGSPCSDERQNPAGDRGGSRGGAFDAGAPDRPEPRQGGGSRRRVDVAGHGGGDEAATTGERDPAPAAGRPQAGHRFFRQGGKSVRFKLVDEAKKEFPVHCLCRVLGTSQSGDFAWRRRPACRRQHEDMALLAHVRSAFALSNGTNGSPRMTRDLRDDGRHAGRRRAARLMRENGLRARRKPRF